MEESIKRLERVLKYKTTDLDSYTRTISNFRQLQNDIEVVLNAVKPT